MSIGPNMTEAEYLRQVLANSKPHICSCGGVFFKQVFTMRAVSKIVSGTGAEAMMPIPMWRCDDCGAPVEQLQVQEDQNQEAKKTTSGLIL